MSSSQSSSTQAKVPRQVGLERVELGEAGQALDARGDLQRPEVFQFADDAQRIVAAHEQRRCRSEADLPGFRRVVHLGGRGGRGSRRGLAGERRFQACLHRGDGRGIGGLAVFGFAQQGAQHVHRGLIGDFVAAVHTVVDEAVVTEGAHRAHHFRRRLVVAHAPFLVRDRQRMIGRGDAGRGVAAVHLGHREVQREQHAGTRLGFLFNGVAVQVDQPGHQRLALQVDLPVCLRAIGIDSDDAAVVDQHGAVFQCSACLLQVRRGGLRRTQGQGLRCDGIAHFGIVENAQQATARGQGFVDQLDHDAAIVGVQ
ncbi:hypothetical protein G6F24_013830 [Rhizopus arrhizus]|nr:hypothetical protein G6F24_013830 [Rhizopus arrhizus]